MKEMLIDDLFVHQRDAEFKIRYYGLWFMVWYRSRTSTSEYHTINSAAACDEEKLQNTG